MRKFVAFVGQPHLDREPLAFDLPIDFSVLNYPFDPQQGMFVDVKIGVHRVLRDDGRQQRFVLLDQVADGQQISADDAVDRGNDARKFDVEPGRLGIGLGGGDRGDGLVASRGVFVHVLLADSAGRLGDFNRPGIVGLGQLQLRLGQANLPQRAVQGGLVRARVDQKEPLPGFNFGARYEINRVEIAGYPGLHLDGFGRLDATGKISIIGYLSRGRLGHADHGAFILCFVRRVFIPIGAARGETRNCKQGLH